MLAPCLLEILRAYYRILRPAGPQAVSLLETAPAPVCGSRANRLPRSLAAKRPAQTRHPPHPPSQLCHPSARARCGHPRHPGAAGPQPHRHHRPLRLPSRRPPSAPPPVLWINCSNPARASALNADEQANSGVGRHLSTTRPAYRQAHPLPLYHHRLMQAIETCRTELLGGSVEGCDHCQYTHTVYRSCGNRHCPKCQGLARERWLQKRQAE